MSDKFNLAGERLTEDNNHDDLVGKDCVAFGRWMQIEESYPDGSLTAIDQDGGDHQIHQGDVDHWY